MDDAEDDDPPKPIDKKGCRHERERERKEREVMGDGGGIAFVCTLVGCTALLWFLLQLAIANPQYRSWKKEWIAIVVASIGWEKDCYLR